MNIFQFIRNRFHPLHHLRKNRIFRETILPAFDKPVPAKVDWLPHPWWVKRITHAAYIFAPDDVESSAIEIFRKLLESLPPNGTILDIGANVGRFTWHAAALRSDVKIHAFEPDRANFQLLEKTNQECRHPSVTLHHAAVSDRAGTADFSIDSTTGATGTLEKSETFSERHFAAKNEHSQVSTVNLDGLGHILDNVVFMKIDVEGHENAVFAGAERLISNQRPIMLFECFVHPLPFKATLENLGYLLVDADSGDVCTEKTTDYWAVPSDSELKAIFEH